MKSYDEVYILPIIESVVKGDRFMGFQNPDNTLIEKAMDNAIEIVMTNMKTFVNGFPHIYSENLFYKEVDNVNWTPGFWTGIAMIAYEMTKDVKIKRYIGNHFNDFALRIEIKQDIQTHDLGYLYSLSCVAGYKVFGDEEAKDTALKAARELLGRYHEPSGMILSGHTFDEVEEIRVIIDCMLNLPLLYWAYEETGNKDYYVAAKSNAVQSANYLVRQDASSYQVCFLDKEEGHLLRQATHQGYSDKSTWSRGQSWGIYGFALSYEYTRDKRFLEISKAMANYYLNRLPSDDIACWDLDFIDDEVQRDSSSASVAVCGLKMLSELLPDTDTSKAIYEGASWKILSTLIQDYTTNGPEESNGLLKHGTSGMPRNFGVDECTIYGDYFYMEALRRFMGRWKMYW